jgi:hypothetical protein
MDEESQALSIMNIAVANREAGLSPALATGVTGLGGAAIPVGAVLKEAARVAAYQFIFAFSLY